MWSVQLLWGTQQNTHHTWCQVYSPGGNFTQILRGEREGEQHSWDDETGQEDWLVTPSCRGSRVDAGSAAGQAQWVGKSRLVAQLGWQNSRFRTKLWDVWGKEESRKPSAVWYKGSWISSLCLAGWKYREVSGWLAGCCLLSWDCNWSWPCALRGCTVK